MHYLLYFPRASGMSAEPHLERCGLAGLSRDRQPEVAPLDRGPDGKPGLICAWRKGDAAGDPPLALTPSQDWKPCRPGASAAKGDFWIGFDRDRPPRPEDLARRELYAGYWVALKDGQQWHVPTAGMLPHVHGLAEDGTHQRRIAPEFAALWEQSRGYAEQIFQALGQLELLQKLRGKDAPQKLAIDVPVGDLFALCVEALALNYRVNAELADRLGLFGDAELRNVLMLIVDLPVLLKHDQKKKPASLSMSVGWSTSSGAAA